MVQKCPLRSNDTEGEEFSFVQTTEEFIYTTILHFLMDKNTCLRLIRLQLIELDCFQS